MRIVEKDVETSAAWEPGPDGKVHSATEDLGGATVESQRTFITCFPSRCRRTWDKCPESCGGHPLSVQSASTEKGQVLRCDLRVLPGAHMRQAAFLD